LISPTLSWTPFSSPSAAIRMLTVLPAKRRCSAALALPAPARIAPIVLA